MSLIYIEDIKKHTENISLLNDKNKNEIVNFGVEDISMPEFIMPTNEEEINDCDAFMMKLFNKKESKLNIKNKIKEKAQREFKNRLNDIIQLKDIVVNSWNNIKEICKNIINIIVDEYKNVISYFNAEFAKIKNIFKSLKKSTSLEDKKIKRERLKKEIKKYGGDILEIFGIVEIYYSLKSVWGMLKNIWGGTKNTWNDLINNFKELKNLFKDNETSIGKKVYNWTSSILVLLANLAIGCLAAIENAKTLQKENEDVTENILEQINKEKIESNNLQNKSFLLTEYKKDNHNSSKENKKDTSICSICPVEYDNTPITDEYIGYAIEIGMDINTYSLNKNINDNIFINDIIGYIDKKPIKSKIEGIVIDRNDRYLLVKPNNNFDISFANETNEDNNEINKIVDAFDNLTKIETLIKEDVIFTYKPIFIKNNLGPNKNDSKTSATEKYNNLIEKYNKKVKELENNIKQKTNSNAVREALNKNDNGLILLKDEILKLKKNFFSETLSYLTSNNTTYTSSNQEDYKLIDYYYQWLYNFNYDKDNPYKNELYNIIFNFIQDRKKIESLNVDNIKKDFNKLALDIQKDKNFFDKIKNNIKNLSNVEDIYNIIKKTCNIEVSFDSKEINTELINGEYINSMLNNNDNNSEEVLSDKDKEKIKKDKIAKKLAIMLHLLLFDNKTNTTNDKKTLKSQTSYESEIIITFYYKILTKYNYYLKITENIDSLNNNIQWPIDSIIYIDNKKYTHFLFTNEKNDIIVSEYESNTYMYWLKYCGMATLVNCALPMYWGTGFIAAGVPVLLPIILIPIHVVKGSCICVIGLGICGMAVYPMLIYANMSEEIMSYLFPVNMTIDILKDLIKTTKEKSKEIIKEKFNSNIKSIDKMINKTKKEIEDIKKEIEISKNI